MERVQVIDQLVWPFRDGADAGRPYVYPETDRGRTTPIGVDPFPAYGHDPDVVRETLERVSEAFPLPEPFAPVFFLLQHETLSRTNGQAALEFDYDWQKPDDAPDDEDTQRPWRGYVVLSAKRIPPHPAMTRYLVAHEYGHVVEDWLIRRRRERAYSHDLLLEYAERRGLSPSAFVVGGSGGQWHRAIQEIFANDFRICRTGIEPEYWPHPGIDRPGRAAKAFWRKTA